MTTTLEMERTAVVRSSSKEAVTSATNQVKAEVASHVASTEVGSAVRSTAKFSGMPMGQVIDRALPAFIAAANAQGIVLTDAAIADFKNSLTGIQASNKRKGSEAGIPSPEAQNVNPVKNALSTSQGNAVESANSISQPRSLSNGALFGEKQPVGLNSRFGQVMASLQANSTQNTLGSSDKVAVAISQGGTIAQTSGPINATVGQVDQLLQRQFAKLFDSLTGRESRQPNALSRSGTTELARNTREFNPVNSASFATGYANTSSGSFTSFLRTQV